MVLAADLGGTKVKYGLVCEGTVREFDFFSVDEARLAAVLPRLRVIFNQLLERETSQCQAIGISIACLVDPVKRRALKASKGKYEDAVDIDLVAWSKEQLGLPLTLETDSRSTLVGEWRYGAGQGYDNLVMVTFGTAIGVAVLLQGKLLRGVHFQAGFGGHLIVNPGGRPCNCGGRGCVTAEASTWALASIVQSDRRYQSSQLSQVVQLDFATLFSIAEQGDKLAREIRDRCLEYWAAMVASLIHAYDPEVVILGGGVMASADTIIPIIEPLVRQWSWTPWGRVDVRRAHYLEEAALLGVSYLVLHKVKAI